MYFLKLTFLIGAMSVCFSIVTKAEEKPAIVAEGPHSGKQDQNWEVVQNNLVTAKTKLDAQAALLSTLIIGKSNLSGDELVAKIEEIKTQHIKYEQMVTDYNKQNDDYLTKYPERGVKEKRIYRRVKMKTLESFEDDITLRGRMNKLHNKVLRQYPRAKKQQSTSVEIEEDSKNSTIAKPNTNKKAPEVTETINLKK